MFFEKVSDPSNPPHELPPNVSEENPLRTNYSVFFLQKSGQVMNSEGVRDRSSGHGVVIWYSCLGVLFDSSQQFL